MNARLLRRAAVLGAMALVVGCSTADKPKPTPLGVAPAKIAGRVVWTARLDGVPASFAPAVAAGSFVVAGADGSVRALRVEDGREAWRVAVGSRIAVGVGSDGHTSAVVTRDQELVAVRAEGVAWRTPLAARVVTPPLVAGERIFVVGADRSVHAFDAGTGDKLWTFTRAGDPLSLAQAGVLAPFRDTLLVGHGARLLGLDPLRGTLRWEVPLATPRGSNEIERLADLVGPAARAGDTVCARAFQAAVACADAASGRLRWSHPSGGTTAVGADEAMVVGADATDRLTGWKAAGGEVVWQNEDLRYRRLAGVTLVGPLAVFGDSEGIVHFVDRDKGQTVLRLATDGSAVVGPPARAGATLLVTTRSGGLHALRPN